MKKWDNLIEKTRDLISSSVNLIKPGWAENSKSQTAATLKIAGYNIILMNSDGDVVWTREWDAGGAFEFRPNFSMWIFCEFTNHSKCETEIAEYEIELVSEEGIVVERFGSAFGDAIIVVPGQSKVFSGQWRL